ncbi:MAG: protein kinase [Planctomycetota bacterium]|nr:protein kinase [Planctomycetota bacterium]
MSKQTKHPTENELTAFSLGQLPPEAALVVEQHVSECDSCCETIVDLVSDDTFVDLLQEVKATSKLGSATVLHQTQPSIPTPLRDHARYQIEEIIGRGGMGQVYKARHRMMDRTVALKVIHSEWVQKQEAVDRFRREVKTAASLDHRNIVTAHDAEQAGELHFLAMEFVDGIDLAQTVQNRGRLPVSNACNYIRQAATGLDYAHKRGMVHRDIKPHNLMVTKGEVVKILDFGLASLAPQATPGESITEDSSGNLTMAGAIMGTPDFISPEQAQDARGVDGRSDIYSLGMTMYYLLAGKVPFSEGTAISKLKLHAESNPTPLNELRDDIPVGVQDILAKMIAKDPAKRFQSPSEIVDALEPFVITTIDTSASGTIDSDLSVKPKGWGWWPRIAAASVAILLIAGASMLLKDFFGLGTKAAPPDEVHASLSELDSYVVSMMNSPHNLVFMNLSDIGPNRNYLTFEPIEGGVDMRLPVFPAHAHDKRQSGYAMKLKQIASELSLATRDESEVRNGKIDGITVIVEVKGSARDVADTVQQLVQRTFEVEETEECEFVFRNLPSEASAKIGNGPTEVSAEAFVAEQALGRRVYFGEHQNWIFLVPTERKAEKQFQKNADVWYTNINGLPDGFANTLRTGVQLQDASKESPLAAEDLVAKFEGAHKNEAALIISAICKAAGIPNEQWQAVAKSPTASTKSISGEPLSIVLLSDSRFFEGGFIDPDFRYLGDRIPKPSDLSDAMALSTANGFYSILQPQYITDLTYEVEAAESDTVKLTGRVQFNGLGMYAGRVQFSATIDSDLNILVTEFALPTHEIGVQRERDCPLGQDVRNISNRSGFQR